MKNKKILILTGGKVSNLSAFSKEAKVLGTDLKIAAFSDLEYDIESAGKGSSIKIGDRNLADFGVIYFRLLGDSTENAAIVADYAKRRGIRIVDSLYEKPEFVKLPLPKGLETMLLYESGVPVPHTMFMTLRRMVTKAPDKIGFPLVVKGTNGKRGRAVWSPGNQSELAQLVKKLKARKLTCERFIVQEFIKASIRIRVFVIGEKAKAAIVRPQRWVNRFSKELPPNRSYKKVPSKYSSMAEKAAKALSIDIAGVDILETKNKKLFVLEVNSAPKWNSIKRDTGFNVEREILKFLINL
jgi:ribosomal protein S6--L-glutamate ligase